jgi:hypothetical protein
MNDRNESRLYEAQAHRLRAEDTHDWLVRAFVALDLAIRRAACRVFSTDSAPRRTPCRW